MLITERKRAVYDQRGVLHKVDILRSVRRKDAPPSAIQDMTQDMSLNSLPPAENKKKSWLLRIVIVLIVLLIGGKWLLSDNVRETLKIQQINAPFETLHVVNNKKPITMAQLRSMTQSMENITLPSPNQLERFMLCNETNENSYSCELKLSLKITK